MEINRYCSLSKFGPKLKVNEDLVSCDIENSFFSLYDAFGGLGVGDKAVVELSKNVNNFLLKISEDEDSTLPFYYNFNYNINLNALVNAVTCGHRILLKENQKKPLEKKAACSGAFMMQTGRHLSMLFVGNVFAYLLREGSIFPIYECNSSLRNFASPNMNFGANIPISAMGMYYQFDYHVEELILDKNDRVVLCSDGAVNRLSLSDVSQTLLNRSCSQKNILENLFSRNNSLGNQDNQSSIIVDY